jgi:hypothetical protein
LATRNSPASKPVSVLFGKADVQSCFTGQVVKVLVVLIIGLLDIGWEKLGSYC